MNAKTHNLFDHETFLNACAQIAPNLITNDPMVLEQAVTNVSGLTRSLAALLTPHSLDDLQTLMKLANQHQVALHPISTGRNWGFGSKLPFANNQYLLDLRHLNQIREYDEHFGVVTIEPGVTQRQLHRFLQEHHSDYYLDITGSSADTSVVGNTLERGIAYNSLRVENIIRMEVLLPNGEFFKTGFGSWETALVKDLFPWAPGPQWDGLFVQSPLGVVTAMTVQLSRKPEHEIFFNFNFPTSELVRVIDGFAKIKHHYSWPAIVHIANRGRSEAMIKSLLVALHKQQDPTTDDFAVVSENAVKAMNQRFPHELIAIGSIKGPKSLVTEIHRSLRRQFKGNGIFSSFTHRKIGWALGVANTLGLQKLHRQLELAKIFSGLSWGQTTNATLQGFFSPDHIYGADHPEAAEFVDPSKTGFIYCVPLAPLTGAHGERMTLLTHQICGKYQMQPEITLNTITHNVLEAVISVSFDKSLPAERQRALDCVQALHEHLMANGYFPYRWPQGIQAPQAQKIPNALAFRQLKSLFDPLDLVSRGRFG
jgi:4-cresol dehydrogenase (hydroxylating)